MPRTPIDLEAYKDKIIPLYLQDHSVEDLRKYLLDQGVKVGNRTLKTALAIHDGIIYLHGVHRVGRHGTLIEHRVPLY